MYHPSPSPAAPPMIGIFTRRVGWVDESVAASVPASATYDEADLALYYPILLPACVVRRVWWANGATTTGGATVAVGVYADAGYKPGAKLVSGSATQGTASQVQFVDVTDTTLAPGRYWIALHSSSATSTTFMRSLGIGLPGTFRMEQSVGGGLPATATPVESVLSTLVLCGFATTASP